ncbi:hypothetical protein FPV67DRAFT_1560370 [Lyophyllum atratum]|nr:hypothetical protein FPV67DRAFT_1560370 [Lyophyllum atratum]
MRESNFAFPTQNKACVCITSQLYDRRALDTTSPLPLLNSLTHLTYLTSTSPRIREIMTMDGGLERLVRILHDFCICPPPQENGAVLYGLIPPTLHPPKPVPTLNPATFDKQAAYRFSLAFQCVVNIGVRGSEPIRSRVVQAGTLEVVGCILEAWLANKGFAVGASSSATGMPRETREQRSARREAQLVQRQREQAAELERQRNRQPLPQRGPRPPTLRLEEDSHTSLPHTSNLHDALLLLSASSASPSGPPSGSDTELSTDASTAPTPIESGTPTGSVVVPSRDRSGTIIARPIWDPAPPQQLQGQRGRGRGVSPDSPAEYSSSRPDTETEDDGEVDADGDVDMDRERGQASGSGQYTQRHTAHAHRLSLSHSHARRAVGIVSDDPPAGAVAPDAHIIINEDPDAGGLVVGVGLAAGGGAFGVGVGGGGAGGVEDGIVSLEANDDFAMGAPPGAPGAIAVARAEGMVLGGESEGEGEVEGGTSNSGGEGEQGGGQGRGHERRRGGAPDETPRPGVAGPAAAVVSPARHAPSQTQPAATGAVPSTSPQTTGHSRHHRTSTHSHTHHHHHHHHGHGKEQEQQGPYRDEDVLLSLQLLAYLSKYPHVRQAFYKPRVTFHPASVDVVGGKWGVAGRGGGTGAGERGGEREVVTPGKGRAGKEREKEGKETGASGFFRSLGEKEKESTSMVGMPSSSKPQRQTNVFSLVERFTFKPSSTEADLPVPPPRLPPEIQYWAGVVMRNACRKDDSRGGIRQCANMLCGRWETYPREFAKCRRCRKAKYCGKECQSTAWSEGHRFWCSAKDDEDPASASASAAPDAGGGGGVPVQASREGRERRARERVGVGEREGEWGGEGLRGPGMGGGVRRGEVGRGEGWPEPRRGGARAHQGFVQQQQQPIGTGAPGSSRTREREAGVSPAPGAGVAGRRRAETVTGVMGGGGGVMQGGTHYHGHGRLPPPMRTFAVGAGGQPAPYLGHHQHAHQSAGVEGGGGSGSGRRRRAGEGAAAGVGFRSPVEESDMVLG